MDARRVAVITGGSSGIGASLARALAARGWLCVLLARREERLRALAEEVRGEYEVCDVADRHAVDAVAARVQERHPRIKLLALNAGIPGGAGFLDADAERIENVIRVNYLGGVWCLRAFLPALEAAVPSDVVNVISVAGTATAATSGLYSASKHAQLSFSRAVTAELKPRGVRVHGVLPGFTQTEGFPVRRELPPAIHAAVLEPEDVAGAIIRAVDRNKLEVFVPGYLRIAPIAQALVPGVVARVAASSRVRTQRR
jgi:short-subunit dehydrogenase